MKLPPFASLAVALLLADPSLGAAQETADTEPAGRTAQVEEIVVQARKRAELLEETPVAVTALSESTLREANVTQIDQIQDLVPNLTFVVGGSGQEQSLFIRGVGAATLSAAFEPGVGFYVDGVFLPRAQGGILDVVDVQQVEVLRGPQGTLFGKNNIGGAVNITTIKPHRDLEAFAMVRPGNFGTVDTRIMLNLPVGPGWLEDKLFVRTAFSSQNRGGYTYNRLRDEYWNDRNSLTFLGSLRFLPVEHLTIDVSGTWWQDHSSGRGGQCVFVQETSLGSIAPGFYDACRQSEPFDFDANVAQVSNPSNAGVWGTLQYDFGAVGLVDDLSLKSITSWRKQHIRNRQDFDMTSVDVLQVSQLEGEPQDGRPGESQQIQQELQVNGTAWDGRISFVSGLFLFWEDSNQTNTTYVGFLPNTSANNVLTDNFTWALFGQATGDITDWLSLTAGLRYTSDGKKATQINGDPFSTDGPTFDESGEETFTSWTPMATLATIAPDSWLDAASLDHLMGYFTYSRGFKGGGFNAAINPTPGAELTPFDPETLDNFEVGVKAIGFDQLLTMNLALFWGIYDDIQVNTVRVEEDDQGDVVVRRLTLNAAKATTRGVELELGSRPIEGLQIRGNIGYVDAFYDDFPDAVDDLTNESTNRAGQTFNYIPKLNTFVSVQYSVPIDAGGSPWMQGWLTPRVEWAYRSMVHMSGPEVTQAVQPGYNLLNARLSYDFLDDRAQVALWARNLTDQEYTTIVLPLANLFGHIVRYYGAPRTFGAELSYRFGG